MLTPNRETLLNCLHIERWADDLASRSYHTMLELERTAVAAATPLSTDEIDEAVAAHPSVAEGQGELADTASGDLETSRRLTDGSARYEQRFGRVFVIRAEGRSLEQIVSELERRLDNDDVAELAEVADQLRGIALVRLRDEYADQFNAESAH